MRVRRLAPRPTSAIAIALLVATMVLGLSVGTVPIGTGDVLRALGSALGLAPIGSVPAWVRTVIVDLRLPRILAAMLVGIGLTTTGTALQAVFRNPLADPAVLGIAQGAALGGSAAVYTGLGAAGAWVVPACAFVCASASAAVVYAAAVRGGRAGTATLLLVGIAVGSLLSAGTSLVISLSLADYRTATQLMHWLLGGLDARSYLDVSICGACVLAALVLVAAHAREMDALLLSEEQAASVGVDVHRTRRAIVIAAALGTAGPVSIAGVVPFVGLVVPHLLRRAVGPLHRRLVPASVVGGSLFVLVSDMVARRAIAPAELQLGAVTSVLGAPLFLWLLLRDRRGES